MPGFDEYIKRNLAEKIANTKGESLSEMVDSLNKFEEKPLKVVDLEADIANLKMKIASQKPLFTLTAEEVEEIRQTLVYALDERTDWIIANAHKLDDYERSVLERLNEKDQKNLRKIYEYQGIRIKQWEDGST